MSTSDEQTPTTVDDKTPEGYVNGHNSVDVYLKDTVGAVFLGILTVILLVGWMRSEARVRALIQNQEVSYANRLPNA